MRTRKANKSQRKSYAATFRIGSDDSEDDLEQAQDQDADVDFGVEEVHEASEADEIDDTPAEDDKLSDQEQDPESDDSDESDEAILDDAPMRKGRKLPKRAHVHEVSTYPADLQATRIYDGPLKQNLRGPQLLNILYGPDPDHVKVFRGMLRKWFDHQVLPSARVGEGGVMSSPWLAEDFEVKQKYWSRAWHDRFRAAKPQRMRKIRPDHVDMFKPPMNDLSIAENGQLLGSVSSGSQEANRPKDWLLDTGGIPIAMGWAPSTGHKEQFIAVCSVPFGDQEAKDGSSFDDDPEEKKKGSVQIWSIPCHKVDGNEARLLHFLSFDWGRPKRLQWCPVPPPDDSKIGLVAILAADGLVRIVEVPKASLGDQENYEWMESPVATLGITDEYSVKATCLTWVNTNRVCLGHSDGSISLWSVYPQQMLSRRPVHVTYILDIMSGFPSHPYHIVTSPVGGCTTLTDLNLPSAETTYIPLHSVVNFQPNLLDWNDHLQGFFAMHPSPTPQNTVVGYTHIKFFVQSRALLTADSPPMCIASGKTHPFTLVGCADGSLWAFNPMRVLMKEPRDELHKLQVLQHEFRPPQKIAMGAANIARGAARILQGFKPVFNNNPRVEIMAEYMKRLKMMRPANLRRPVSDKSHKKKSHKKKGEESDEEGENGMGLSEEAYLAQLLEKSKTVVHESRTRITVAAWNPNVEFGWWAAAAMGSGLVKIMDLGLTNAPVA
ncbi:hypothetical protein N0V82_000243 [Gnomoniopsis sp. IMI 355080]|nr:hypothetical protein N0V82_000243 [Gnomoniopsis sp. IMI 355080]